MSSHNQFSRVRQCLCWLRVFTSDFRFDIATCLPTRHYKDVWGSSFPSYVASI